jgi:polyisoprenoid-binding protein YceI
VGRRRWILVAAAVVVAVPATAYGYLVWNTKDSPDRAQLAPPISVASTPPASRSTAGSVEPPAPPQRLDGDWVIVADGGFVGYRIRERLGPLPAPSDAVGRTDSVVGTATISGRQLTDLEIVVDMTSLRSDVDARDDLLRTQALETSRFQEARFTLSEPVDLPDAQIGDVVSLRIAGELTLHGQTNPVVIELQARWDGPSIQVAGSAPIRRADFDISVDGLPGFRIDSSGIFEVQLALVPAGSNVEPTASTIVDNPATRTGIPDDAPCPGDAITDLAGTLTFTTFNVGGYDVWIAEPGVEPRPLFDLASSAAWSPDGSRIVYSAAPNTDEPTELMVANADGTAPSSLRVRDAFEPDWSPDGTVIAFTRPNGPARSEIWVVNADGTSPRHLIGDEELDASQPRWTPDGTGLIFTSLSDASNDDVMIANADGTDVRSLVNSEAYEYSGSIQAGQLVYVADGQVFVAGLDGSNPHAVTAGPNDGDPALAADATALAFVTRGNLYLGDLVPGNDTCLVVGRGVAGDVRWRPTV